MTPPTLCSLFQARSAERDDRPALTMTGHPGYTWRAYAEAVRRLAPGLAALGVGSGEAVAILSGPRPEFHLADTALLHAGAVPFSLQEGDTVARMVASLHLAGVHHLVTEHRLLATSLEVAAAHGGIEAVVCLDPTDAALPLGVLGLEEVMRRPGPAFEALWRAVGPEHIATLIFTSGTTGTPKAVQLSHRAISTAAHGTHLLAPFRDPTGTVLSYLPMNHIAERFMSHYASLTHGVTVHSVPHPERLHATIREIRPVRFFGVPRVYEKLVDRARALIEADPALGAALAASLVRVRAEQAGESLGDAEVAAAEEGCGRWPWSGRHSASTVPSTSASPPRHPPTRCWNSSWRSACG